MVPGQTAISLDAPFCRDAVSASSRVWNGWAPDPSPPESAPAHTWIAPSTWALSMSPQVPPAQGGATASVSVSESVSASESASVSVSVSASDAVSSELSTGLSVQASRGSRRARSAFRIVGIPGGRKQMANGCCNRPAASDIAGYSAVSVSGKYNDVNMMLEISTLAVGQTTVLGMPARSSVVSGVASSLVTVPSSLVTSPWT